MRTGAPRTTDVVEAGGTPRFDGAIPVLGGQPIACVDVGGKVIDVSVMTPLGCNTRRASAVVDRGDAERVDERYAAYRASSDVAQVVACYLRCHPRVEEVRYPGLKGDPSFEVASVTLQGGFGPFVDYCVDGCWRRLTCEPGDAISYVVALEDELS